MENIDGRQSAHRRQIGIFTVGLTDYELEWMNDEGSE